jgi:hypothetical protein
MSKALIEIPLEKIGMIRVGDDDFKYGEKYHWCANIIWITDEEVEIALTLTAPSLDDWKAVLKELQNYNVKVVMIKRYKNNQIIERRFDVNTGRLINKKTAKN